MILERDIGKLDSVAGRSRDSVLDRSSNVWDSKRAKAHSVSVDQVIVSWIFLDLSSYVQTHAHILRDRVRSIELCSLASAPVMECLK